MTAMPSGRPSGTLFSAQSLLWVSLPPSFALPGRVEAEKWSPRGPKGVSGGPRKSHKIDSKSLSVPIGGLRRAWGYPRGACGTPKVHIYEYFQKGFCVKLAKYNIYIYRRQVSRLVFLAFVWIWRNSIWAIRSRTNGPKPNQRE